MKEKRRINWIFILSCIACFLVGILFGSILGIDYTITKIAESIGIVTQGSTINISVNLNETQIVDRSYEHFNPYLDSWNRTITGNWINVTK